MRVRVMNTVLEECVPILSVESSTNCPNVSNLNSPENVYQLMIEVFNLDIRTEEYVYLLTLNTKHNLIGVFEISHGLVDAALLCPREIYMKSLLCGACAIIIVHNHPSGIPEPSTEDVETCKRIKEIGDLIGIRMLDSIIVGQGKYISLKEKNVC